MSTPGNVACVPFQGNEILSDLPKLAIDWKVNIELHSGIFRLSQCLVGKSFPHNLARFSEYRISFLS